MMQGLTGKLVAVVSERKLKEAAQSLCQGLTAATLQEMVDRGITVEMLMEQTNHRFPVYRSSPGTQYLMSLSDQQLLTILAPALPAHVAVLRQNPAFCAGFIRDLKRLAGAAAQN